MQMMTPGRLAAGIAGTTGAGSMGVLAGALVRIAAAHAVPAGMWVVMAVLIAVTAGVASLGLILDYRQKKLETESAAALQQGRQEMYRVVVEKSAGDPGNAMSYRELIIADALHLSVERNGAQLADRMYWHLHGPGSWV
jgi:hypothetical protein